MSKISKDALWQDAWNWKWSTLRRMSVLREQFKEWRRRKKNGFYAFRMEFSLSAGVDITRSNEASWETEGLRLIVPLSMLNRISLLKIQQAFNIIYVEHSSAFWLPAERIMLQASFLQPTGQLNLDLPNNGTKIHSCVTILHRRHGKTWLISYSSNHLCCINKALVFWHSHNQGINS